ncbi:MAG: TonB-dependent receptor, partial [Gammaproteobacteria bacterium]|nr:TonB-dependent receptor [Gammaproteobacteria bacterium]
TNGFDVDDWVELLGREKNRAQIAVSYSQGKWSATWQGHYVGEGWLDSSARDHDGTSTPLFEFARTDSMLTHNATVSYEFNERFSARLVINNLTEETQPRELRQFANVFARVGRTYVFAFKARL